MSKFCLNETHDTDFPLEVPLLQCSKQKKLLNQQDMDIPLGV